MKAGLRGGARCLVQTGASDELAGVACRAPRHAGPHRVRPRDHGPSRAPYPPYSPRTTGSGPSTAAGMGAAVAAVCSWRGAGDVIRYRAHPVH